MNLTNDSVFQFYEGTDSAHYTDLTGVNLNAAAKALLANDVALKGAVNTIEGSLSTLSDIKRAVSNENGLFINHWRNFGLETKNTVTKDSDDNIINSYSNKVTTLSPTKKVAPWLTDDGEQPDDDYYMSLAPEVEYDAYGLMIPKGNPNPYVDDEEDTLGKDKDGNAVNSYMSIGGGIHNGIMCGGDSYGNDGYSRMNANGENGEWIDVMVIVCRTGGSPHRHHRTALTLRQSNPGQHSPVYFQHTKSDNSDQLNYVYSNPHKLTASHSAIVSGSGYGSYIGANIIAIPNGITKNNNIIIENNGYTNCIIYAIGFGKMLRKPDFDRRRGV